jgi:4,5-dihydroxyphthalate decarboxylase
VAPINHMVVVSKSLSEEHPEVVRELHRMFSEADAINRKPLGQAYMRRSLRCITEYCTQQGLIPREFSVDELFDDVTRPLLERIRE